MEDVAPRWWHRALTLTLGVVVLGLGFLVSASWLEVIGGGGVALSLLLALHRPFTLAAVACVTAVLAVLAILLDPPEARLATGAVALISAAVCTWLWLRAWQGGGGRLELVSRGWEYIVDRLPSVVLVLAMIALAVIAAESWSLWLFAPVAGVVAGAVVWRQGFGPIVRIAAACAMTLAIATTTVRPAWLAAGLLVVIAVIYLTFFVRALMDDEAVGAGEIGRRYRRLGGRILISVLLLVGAIVGLALVGGPVAHSAYPLSLSLLRWSAIAVAAIVAAVICWWWRSYERVVRLEEEPGFLVGGLLGVVVVGAVIGVLGTEAPITERSEAMVTRSHRDALGRFDLVLVVDPGDPVGRALIARAEREVARIAAGRETGTSIFAPRIARSPYDVEYGIAVPQTGRAPLRLIESPTSDTDELLAALANLTPQERPHTRALRRVAREGVDERLVKDNWRPGARPGLALLMDRLPALAPAKRARRTGAPKSAAEVHVVTRDRRTSRQSAWLGAVGRYGGALDASHAPRASKRLRRASGETALTLLRDATDLHTGVPVGALRTATWKYRPVLLFDKDARKGDRQRPVDVDWMLASERPARLTETSKLQKVCDRAGLLLTCDHISGADGLSGSLDEFIDLAGEGRPPATEATDPSRMYVHVRTVGTRVYLGYWWFLRYNGSPWRGEINCLPGLSFGAISCHDHEGDWEGVTVVLDADSMRPEAAIYDAHGREIRWPWAMLRLDKGRPLVFVAGRSHASYPESCARDECDQRLGNKEIGDGGFDGGVNWDYNGDEKCREGDPEAKVDGPCLVALPTVDAGTKGVLWNAFLGRWGAAKCTTIGRVCSQVNGPDSPSRQGRFRKPDEWAAGPADAHCDYRKRRLKAQRPGVPLPHTRESAVSRSVEPSTCAERDG